MRIQRPITDERRITVSVWVSRIGNRSWDFDYEDSGPDATFAIGRTTVVAFDYARKTTIQISRALKRDLERHAERPLKFKGAK